MTNFEAALGRTIDERENYFVNAWVDNNGHWEDIYGNNTTASHMTSLSAPDIYALLRREKSRQLCGLPPSSWWNDYV
jgi:hypothetical protein